MVVKARQIGGIFRFYYFLKLLFIYQENNWFKTNYVIRRSKVARAAEG